MLASSLFAFSLVFVPLHTTRNNARSAVAPNGRRVALARALPAFLQVRLVVLLRRVKRRGRHHLGHDGAGPPRLPVYDVRGGIGRRQTARSIDPQNAWSVNRARPKSYLLLPDGRLRGLPLLLGVVEDPVCMYTRRVCG